MLSGSSSSSTETSAEQLLDRFSSGTVRQRRSMIRTIESRIGDLVALQDGLLAPFDPAGDDWAAGWILQVLQRHQPELLTRLLPSEAQGWFRADSAVGIDYGPLQESLLREPSPADKRPSLF